MVSSVANVLKRDGSHFPYAEWLDLIVSKFSCHERVPVVRVNEEATKASEDFLDFHNELSSWDWIYGKTPRFTVLVRDQRITVDKGLVIDGPYFLIGDKFSCDTVKMLESHLVL